MYTISLGTKRFSDHGGAGEEHGFCIGTCDFHEPGAVLWEGTVNEAVSRVVTFRTREEAESVIVDMSAGGDLAELMGVQPDGMAVVKL